MSYTTIKTLTKKENLKNQVVIQITKKQLLNFFRLVTFISLLVINFLAITNGSDLITELLMAQVILLLLFFIKNHPVNSINK